MRKDRYMIKIPRNFVNRRKRNTSNNRISKTIHYRKSRTGLVTGLSRNQLLLHVIYELLGSLKVLKIFES